MPKPIACFLVRLYSGAPVRERTVHVVVDAGQADEVGKTSDPRLVFEAGGRAHDVPVGAAVRVPARLAGDDFVRGRMICRPGWKPQPRHEHGL